MNQAFYREVPSQIEVRQFIDDLVNLLFPIRKDKNISLKEVDLKWYQLQERFQKIVSSLSVCTKEDNSICKQFFEAIPLIYTGLMRDARLYMANDPAATCEEEVVLCYPGFYAVMIHRFSHVLYRLNIPVLPRVVSEYAHSQTGIDIHPGAIIGPQFYIDHGVGIVIGETTVIGTNVKIYQGVTLGATFVERELRGQRRHPTIEDNVILYAGCTILGGDTVIGHDTIIGGNVWLTESVPPNTRVYHKPNVVIR